MTVDSRRSGGGDGEDEADGELAGEFSSGDLRSVSLGHTGVPFGRLCPAMGEPQVWHVGRFLEGVMMTMY